MSSRAYKEKKYIYPNFIWGVKTSYQLLWKILNPSGYANAPLKPTTEKKYIIFPLFFLSIQKKCIFVIEEKIKKDKKSSLYIYKWGI
jgi:hypothetical protein